MRRGWPSRAWVGLLSLAVSGALLGAGCQDGDRSYASERDDDDYDLAAMQLTQTDMPFDAMELSVTDAFGNEEWAQLFTTRDPLLDVEQKLIQLEAQGRIQGHLSVFTWDDPTRNLGKILQVESHATLFEDAEAASDAMRTRACGLLINDDRPLDPFDVPEVADESAGFFHESDIGMLGTAVDTVVCFRTGRLVHAILQNGLDGTQSIDKTVALAERKLEYVDAAFEGQDPPEADDG